MLLDLCGKDREMLSLKGPSLLVVVLFLLLLLLLLLLVLVLLLLLLLAGIDWQPVEKILQIAETKFRCHKERPMVKVLELYW